MTEPLSCGNPISLYDFYLVTSGALTTLVDAQRFDTAHACPSALGRSVSKVVEPGAADETLFCTPKTVYYIR